MRLSRRRKKMAKRYWAWWPWRSGSWSDLYRFSAWFCGPGEGDGVLGLWAHPFAGGRGKRR